MDQKALRFAADCWDRKADKLMYLDGRMSEAERCMDMAIALRQKANLVDGAKNQERPSRPVRG